MILNKVKGLFLYYILYFMIISFSYGASFKPPKGFESAFRAEKTMVVIRNLDGTNSSPIEFDASFESIRLNNKDSINQFVSYLDSNSLTEDYKELILSDFTSGNVRLATCEKGVTFCDIYPETYEVVFDYNDSKLYLFISPNGVKYQTVTEEKVYYDSKSIQNGIINSFDLYTSAYKQQESSISLNDRLFVGLPYGYLKGDIHLNNSDNDNFTAYEAAYHLDFDAYTLKLGHFKYEPNLNQTDFLNNTANISQKSLILSSSDNLLIGGASSHKSISFYVAKSGTVKIYRDERLIHQSNVSEGQNSIKYSELPYGRYSIRLDVISSGEVINSQHYQIYNNINDVLTHGQIDFSVSAGVFNQNQTNTEDLLSESVVNDLYAKGFISYQLLDSTLLGFGGTLSEEGYTIATGASYSFFPLGLNSEIVYNIFDDAQHINANVNIFNFNISYENFENENSDLLAKYMYGDYDYDKIGVYYSYSFSRGSSLYLNYSNVKKKDSTLFLQNEREQYMSIGYRMPFVRDSLINMNLDFSDEIDDMKFSFLWSIPLSDTIETSVGISTSRSELSSFRTSLRKDELIESDSVNSNAEVSNIYSRPQDEMYQEVRASVSGETRYASVNMSAYASTNDSRSINAGISSSQIITTDDVYVTSKKASSYALVDVEKQKSEYTNAQIENKGYLSVKENEKSKNTHILYEDEMIIPLREYKSYQAYLDSESVDLFNSGENNISLFSHPGTVAVMSPKLNQIVSFISSFNDISELPVSGLTCKGEGCLNVSEMVEGVYRITVLDGVEFELVNESLNSCILPYEFSNTDQMNFGKNYCLPIANESDESKLFDIVHNGKELKALYLGVYERDMTAINNKVSSLELAGYKIIKKEIGELDVIYIAQSPVQMDSMLVKHKEEINTIRLLANNRYETKTVSYPVANLN